MNPPTVTVIDYGVGNLLSVQRGFEKCGAKVILTSNPDLIASAERVVLPGVGAFPKAMAALAQLNLISVIKEIGQSNKPLLAICLGMQLLLDESTEFGVTAGLGLISGRVTKIPIDTANKNQQKIPHIGWNSLTPSHNLRNWENTLLQDNAVGDDVYFVHSFMAEPINQNNRIADVIYGGQNIPAVISKDQITGCQFHPEKSGKVGLKILNRFLLQ